MNSVFDYDRYAYFVLLPGFVGKGSRGFTGYTDIDGNACFIWDGRTDRNDNKIPRKFKFSAKERTMRIPLNQKDKNGVFVVEYLEGHPECKGSPNADGSTPFFARMVEEGDADIAIDAKTRRIHAENYVLSLEKDDVFDMAVLFGKFTDKFKIALHCLLEEAGNDPDRFMDVVTDSAVGARVLLHKALAYKLFTKKGGMVKWDAEIIGADEDSAIQRLIKDKDLFDSVTINVKKLQK